MFFPLEKCMPMGNLAERKTPAINVWGGKYWSPATGQEASALATQLKSAAHTVTPKSKFNSEIVGKKQDLFHSL